MNADDTDTKEVLGADLPTFHVRSDKGRFIVTDRVSTGLKRGGDGDHDAGIGHLGAQLKVRVHACSLDCVFHPIVVFFESIIRPFSNQNG
jgi:hypothetical protein